MGDPGAFSDYCCKSVLKAPISEPIGIVIGLYSLHVCNTFCYYGLIDMIGSGKTRSSIIQSICF